jgi:Nitroreductase
MDFKELVKTRQSDRKFKDTLVEKEKIVTCLEAAQLAPSACNSQPWKFVVVDDLDKKNLIAECTASLGMNKYSFQAPVIVAVVLEKMNFTASIGSVIKDKEFSLLDVGISVEHFCLQAADLGLGTCILGWFKEKEVKKILNIPKNKRVPVLILLGYSDSPLREKVRKSLKEISSWNKY